MVATSDPSQPEGREQIRCKNRSCGSRKGDAPGRVILERDVATGLFVKRLGKVNGKPIEAKLTFPIAWPCETCGQHWINPQVMLFDGMAAAFQGAIMETADRVRSEIQGDARPFGRQAA